MTGKQMLNFLNKRTEEELNQHFWISYKPNEILLFNLCGVTTDENNNPIGLSIPAYKYEAKEVN